jgi:hypothetical protein
MSSFFSILQALVFAGALLTILIGGSFYLAYGEEFNYIWAPGEKDGFRKIPIIYLEEDKYPCGYKMMRACFVSGPSPEIQLHRETMFNPSSGGNVWTHEALHSFGVDHDNIYFCFDKGIRCADSYPIKNKWGFNII